jgi:hypothetical protein
MPYIRKITLEEHGKIRSWEKTQTLFLPIPVLKVPLALTAVSSEKAFTHLMTLD